MDEGVLTCCVVWGRIFNLLLQVVLCENHLDDQKQLEETLLHETIHAFDYCRAQMDLDNCLHVACSEVRLLLVFVPLLTVASIYRPCFTRPQFALK